jgi:benzoyl-CoA reductase/2-hydroxyglutaryl-CoA dehydratase subunit BcrC/BadD/HgdB
MTETAVPEAPAAPPKKEKKPLDPNSAKYKLNAIIEKHYREAWGAKEAGEKVGWCASNFPQEIFQTLGLKVIYPENQAAAIAARGGGVRLCEMAESCGFSPDICAYARISLAYGRGEEAPEQAVPMPDFLLCCNNICNCMIKWYENLAAEHGIPLILIDIPFNPDDEVSPDQVAYVGAQFRDAIRQLEELTGKTWDEAKFQEIMEVSSRTCRAWLKATSYAGHHPSPFSGFDLLNHMAVAVCARGTVEAAEAFETLIQEYEDNIATGQSTFPAEEKYRIMFEGIACWPWLRVTFKGLKDRGANMVATIYADAFGFIYDDFDSMVAAYCRVPNAVNLETARDKRIKLARDNGAEGLLVHTNRSCKLWSGFMPEMSRQIGEACGIPVATFDGDQADARNFSEAQYDTRVQALTELIDQRRGA